MLKYVFSSFLIISVLFTGLAFGENDTGDLEKISQIPQPWKSKPLRPTLDEYTETMKYWGEKYSDILKVQVRGKSHGSLPIYLLKITDPAVSDDKKHVILLTALHSGGERSGAMAVLTLTQWLLGDEPLAVETRKNNVVLIMPIINPDGFFKFENSFNSQHVDPYSGNNGAVWDVSNLKLKEPEKTPELVAFTSIIDEFKPDVHYDIHGIAMHYRGQLVAPTVGGAGSNYSLRPWDWRLAEQLMAAGNREGFSYDRLECDAQQLFWGGPATNVLGDSLWMGRPRFYSAMYAYFKYHTLLFTAETGWMESAVEPVKELFRISNEGYGKGPDKDLPVNVAKSQFGGLKVCAYGTTPGERRSSRFELWNRQAAISMGQMYPQSDTREMFAIALTAKAGDTLFSGTGNSGIWMKITREQFLKNIQTIDYINVRAVSKFMEMGPKTPIFMLGWLGKKNAAADQPVQNGVAIQFKILYKNPEIVSLRLNGHVITESPTDGYQTWIEDGCTNVRINIPPAKTKQQSTFIVTCAYKPDVQRTYGWKAPEEVKTRLKNKAK